MSLAESIFTALSAGGSATAALVGELLDCRVYPGQAPAGTAMPYVVYNGVSSVPAGSHEASSNFDQVDIQFSIIGATYLAAVRLRQAIRADLSDVELGGGEKPVEFIERDGYAEGVDAHVLLLDVSIWHNPLV